MMAGVDELSNLIMRELENYSSEVENIAKKEVRKIAKEVKKDLESNPEIPVLTGEYKKGFKIKKVADGSGYLRFKVYNTKYQLTHLLEKGHATRKGGRTKAHPHWKQAQKIADELFERLKAAISK